MERIFFDAILHEDDCTEINNEDDKTSKYEKIGDYKIKDYIERPHEYKK